MTILLLMLAVGCADSIILHPSTSPRNPSGAQRRTLPFKTGQLEIWIARSPGCAGRDPQAYLLEFTGNATRAEEVATYVANRMKDRPIEVWMVNYPGFGGSTGPARLVSIPPAALAAFDALRQVAGDRPILIAGNSIGTAAALYTAAHHPCAGMILQNPPPLRQLLMARYGWWNLWLISTPLAMQVPSKLDSITNASNIHAPAIFVVADSDQLVTTHYKQKIIDAYSGPKRTIVLRGGTHNTATDVSAAEFQQALEWLWPQLR
ncbi:MAG TPA: alpha/beta fold hydrolase [Tepidisphaeraceae bacterium]